MTDIAKLGFEIDTAPLSKAAAEAKNAAQQIGQVGVAADKTAQQTKGATQGAGELGSAFGKINGTLKLSTAELQNLSASLGANGAGNSIQYLIGGLGRLGAALGPVGAAMGATVASVTALGAAYVGLQSKLATAQDQQALLEGRMRNALGSMSEGQKSLKAIYDQTQQTGLGLNSAADAFLRVARNAESIGASKEQILQLSDTISKLGKISGASTGEIQSGMVQLGQALASGRLNGDELRSIMENMPALAKAIAEGLGVSVGQIRALGAAGELTSTKVFEAILKASEKANKEFSELPDTVEQANQRVADNWGLLLSRLGGSLKSSEFMRTLAGAGNVLIGGIAKALDPGSIDAQIVRLQKNIEASKAQMDVGPMGPQDAAEFAGLSGKIAQMESQLAQMMKGRDADANAEAQKAIDTNYAPYRQIAEMGANDYNDFAKNLKKAQDDSAKLNKELARLRASQPMGNPNYEVEQRTLPLIEQQAAVAQAKFEQLAASINKSRQALTDLQRANQIGGGGGGTGIVSAAIGEQRSIAGTAGKTPSLDSLIGVGVQDAAVRAQSQIEAMNRQAKAQQDLVGSTGKTRDVVRELEIAQEAANFRFQTFGTLTGPLITKTVNEYEAALRKSKGAADDFADSKALKASQDALSGIERQIKAVTAGAYAMREAAALARAAQADLQSPNSGASVMQEFYAGERLSSAQMLDQMGRQNSRLSQDNNAIGDPIAQRNLRMQREIEDAQRGASPESQRNIADSVTERYDQERTNELKAQNAEIQRQILLTKEKVNLIGLTGERLVVETALIEKMNQLKQQGIDIYGEEANQILLSTEALAKQQYKIKEAQDQAERYKQIWTNAAKNIQEGLATAFEDAFRKGEFSMKAFFDLFGSVALKVSTNIISAQIIDPLTSFLTKMGGDFLKSYVGSPSVGASPGTGTGPAFTGNLVNTAYGNSFGGGNVIPFARGGILSQPTVFGMANGSSGVAGEAGNEAVLPLKRGNDGKLGVGGGGSGAVSITIIDQRSGGDSKPVEASESRGPDGQRMIQIIVRDEVRRAIRSGELDRDMQSSYGNQRRLVTR